MKPVKKVKNKIIFRQLELKEIKPITVAETQVVFK